MQAVTALPFTPYRTYKPLVCLLLCALADFLFYGEPAGWTFGLFGAILLAACYIYAPAGQMQLRNLLALLTLGQCLISVDAPSLLSISLISLGLISLALLHDTRWHGNIRIWWSRMVRFLWSFPGRFFKDKRSFFRINRRPETRQYRETVMRGWTLPLLSTGIFISLLAMGNPIIAAWTWEIDWSVVFRLFEFNRFFFWGFCICFIWALLRGRMRIKTRKITIDPERTGFLTWLFPANAISRSLVLFNLLFAVQTLMDVMYLWGGVSLPEGMSHAGYAHRGAYPLVFTALLAAAFTLVVYRRGQEVPPVTRTLVYVWIGQNVLLVASSIMRTMLYIENYSLTYLRLSALIWMLVVTGGLILILYRIIHNKSNLWLVNANGLMLLTVLYLCSFVPFKQYIADYNAAHNREIAGKGSNLDVYYLYELGYTSLPAFEQLLKNPSLGQETREYVQLYHSWLLHDLQNAHANWRGWTGQTHRLMKMACPNKRNCNILPGRQKPRG